MDRTCRTLLGAFSAVAVVFGFAGWSDTAYGQSNAEKLYAELAKLPEKERHDRLVEGAKKEGKLAMIHSLRGRLGKAHIAGFTKKYPFIAIENSDMGSQDAAERLVAEETAGRHLTDIISIGVPDATILIEQDRLANYPTPVTKRVLPKYKGFVDDKNRWVPYYWSEYGMSYNTKVLKASEAPKAWFDLCKPQYKGKFSFDPPTTRFLVGMYVLFGEEKAKEWIKCMGENKPIIQRGHTARLKLMLKGDHAIQGGNYLYRGEFLKKKNPKTPFRAVYEAPILGYAGAIVINKNTPHPYAAALFADYTLSDESQQILRKEYRGTIAVKHAYMPDDIKLVTYNYFPAKVVNSLHEAWAKYVGR